MPLCLSFDSATDKNTTENMNRPSGAPVTPPSHDDLSKYCAENYDSDDCEDDDYGWSYDDGYYLFTFYEVCLCSLKLIHIAAHKIISIIFS